MVDKLYIVRHGETALNKDGKNRGWQDIPLNENGKKAAESVGKKLKGKIDCVISSDMKRAIETAEIVAKEAGVDVEESSKEFRPWHIGEYSGKDIKESLPEIQGFIRKPNERIKDGESFNGFANRFINGLERVLREYDGNVALVTHHRGERLVCAWLTSGRDNDKINVKEMMKEGAEPGTYVEYDTKGPSVKKKEMAGRMMPKIR